ncbi:hypothetical protein L6270_02130 [Candidatus Parcubacteria bacterium]|nr:hypothetical protein [Patescibacteria group bacterium]MBU4309454.1 hypothetical protein [Patescibacteria group bacterium]MBU4432416.1 hypothetical protein [Patescibacteria group bacterium]MBU4577815.1 hypothetical protein [Patescibacteria group bacterium]MCG2696808.1 hypothetical protein [Candidatus Parcubacteria bacterium]
MRINFNKIYYIVFVVFLIIFLFRSSEVVRADPKFLPTTVEVLVSCGDGTVDAAAGEICDVGTLGSWPENVGTTTCQMFKDVFNNPFVSGVMHCATDCYAFNTEACYTCGNTYKEKEEGCDKLDFGNSTCLTLGFDSGSLICTPQCQISTINCVAMAHEGGTPGGGSIGGSTGGSSGLSTGFNPGADQPKAETKITVKGKSYPNSDVHVLVDGVVIGIVKADSKADFYFESIDIAPGVANFGFWSEDVSGLKSTLLTITLRIVAGAVTNISGVYIAPSIDVDKQSVKQGDNVKIYGQTVPGSDIKVHINSPQEFIEKIDSQDDGRYELVFNTAPLEEDFHTAKAYFEVTAEGNIIKSGFSKLVSFHVGKEGIAPTPCPNGDLNHDKRVNITDFSILLYNWGTNNACSDQNQNGTVDLIDFSIMMYYWTG